MRVNFILSSVFTLVAGELSEVDLQLTFDWEWNTKNNCGPRPQGPSYPVPPDRMEGTPAQAIIAQRECDIIIDSIYVFNYTCSAPCQTDETKSVTLVCDCFHKVAFARMVRQCEWTFLDNEECPAVQEDDKFDWECDPRKASCPQYLNKNASLHDDLEANLADVKAEARSEITEVNSTISPMPSDIGPMRDSMTYNVPVQAGNQPIIISPVLTQNVGDVSAHAAPLLGQHENYQNHGNSENFDGSYQHMYKSEEQYEELSKSSAQKDAIIAETREKVRSLHSLLKTASEQLDRVEQHSTLQRTILEKGFEKERDAFQYEKNTITKLYDTMLKEKEATLKTTMEELRQVREILISSFAKKASKESKSENTDESSYATILTLIEKVANQGKRKSQSKPVSDEGKFERTEIGESITSQLIDDNKDITKNKRRNEAAKPRRGKKNI